MRRLMPNASQIESGRANILAGEGDVHDLNFTFIVLYVQKIPFQMGHSFRVGHPFFA